MLACGCFGSAQSSSVSDEAANPTPVSSTAKPGSAAPPVYVGPCQARGVLSGEGTVRRTVMTGRFDNDFAHTPVGNVTATGKQVRWELQNIFRYTADGQPAEEWVQTDTVEFLRELGAPGF